MDLSAAGGSSLEDEDIRRMLDGVKSGDRPPQRCLEEAQRLLLKKHDQLKRETMLLIEAAAKISGASGDQGSAPMASPTPIGRASGVPEATTVALKKSTATILVSKNKAKLPLLLKIK